MIQAEIRREGAQIVGFRLSGHADFAESGQDIVCAGVSALAINLVNSLEQIAKIKADVTSDERDGGILDVSVKPADIQKNDVQVLLASFVLGISSVEQQYPEFVSVN